MDKTFYSLFSTEAWAVIKAALLLILAFVVAAIVKSLVVKLFTRTKLSAVLKKSDEANEGNTIEFIGKLAHLLVFLLFIPGIFGSLGMNEISMPILNLSNIMWGYIPNILAAVIVLWVGLFIAKLVRDILIPVFNKMKVNHLQEIAGMEVADTAKLSNTLAYIVYVLILVPVIITALQVLDIKAVSDPAIKMLDIIFEFIPHILAALIIIVVGCMLAKLAGNIVENLIASAGLDSKLSSLLNRTDHPFILSKVIGKTVHVVIVVFFIVESFGVLHLQVLNNIGNAIISYMPYVLAAVLIMIACFVCNTIVQNLLQKSGHMSYSLISKCGIYVIGAFMVLNELGIASEIVNAAFILIIAGLAVAFAIAFGVGGREFAGKVLSKFYDSCNKSNKKSK